MGEALSGDWGDWSKRLFLWTLGPHDMLMAGTAVARTTVVAQLEPTEGRKRPGRLLLLQVHRPGAVGLTVAIGIVLLVLLTGPAVALVPASHPAPASYSLAGGARVPISSGSSVPSADPIVGGYRGTVTVMIQFQYRNAAGLGSLLAGLTNPSSSQYHRFLSPSQFNLMYGPSPANYDAALSYFQSFRGVSITTFSGRTAVVLSGSATSIGAVFGGTFQTRTDPARGVYYNFAGVPTLPQGIAENVAGVVGLNDYAQGRFLGGSSLHKGGISTTGVASNNLTAGKILPPAQLGNHQLLYAPEFQVAYDELPLLQQVLPVHAVVATILWAGINQSGTPVGAFVPSDILTYFNETLPSGEPPAHIYGIPIAGAAPPGASAGYDTTGATTENTIDLEMIGSTAPGASIYNVYGPSSDVTYLDEAFTTILNAPVLANVSVISNSWGSSDGNNSVWYADLQEAQARGITVLASSGDSGNNPNSSKWVAPGVEFPSTMAYDAFGDTAVGGTTLTVQANPSSPTYLQRASEVVWNISTGSGDGGPAGTTGGISSVFPTPIWQRTTEANQIIHSAGRGVPDLGAVANNTLITITVNGALYRATNASVPGAPFYNVWGTSIAAPVLGGFVAELDAFLSAHREAWEGFLNPELYQRGNSQFYGLAPIPAFYDVTSGGNFRFFAQKGYDLLTGWGALNVYAFTETGPVYPVTFVAHGLPGGSTWGVVIAGLNFSTTNSSLTVNETTGIYDFLTVAPSGYTGSPSSGNFTVTASALPPISLNFTAASSGGLIQRVLDLVHFGYNFLNRYLAPYTPYVLLLIAGIIVASAVSSLVDRSRERKLRAQAEAAAQSAAAASATQSPPREEASPSEPTTGSTAPSSESESPPNAGGSPPTPPS